jgi:photosystem II stability/assembly factor-like uncharacterized protein
MSGRYLLPFVILLILSLFPQVPAQTFDFRWQSLDGPFWARGNSVVEDFNGHQYLVGSNGSGQKVFKKAATDGDWMFRRDDDNAVEILAFHAANPGWAYYSVVGNYVRFTNDGGANWNWNNPAPNSQYTTLMLSEYMGSGDPNYFFVGSQTNPNQKNMFFTSDLGQTWQTVGEFEREPINDWTINDLATGQPYSESNVSLAAATDNGIYTHASGLATSWIHQAWTTGLQFKILENLGGAVHRHQWAAVVNQIGEHSLYFGKESGSGDYWDENYSYAFPSPPSDPFSHPINDIAAFRIYNSPYQAAFFATPDGLYLFTGSYEDPASNTVENFIDLGASVHQLSFDHDILSVSYITPYEGNNYKAHVAVGTKNNVYFLDALFNSSGELVSVNAEEAVTGTFLSDVISASFPKNSSTEYAVFTISDNGIIKNTTGGKKWSINGLTYDEDGETHEGTDIITDFTDPAYQYILASSNHSNEGTVVRSIDGGNSWSTAPLPSPGEINAVELSQMQYSNHALCAGTAASIFYSSDNGGNWQSGGLFNNPNFSDVLLDASIDGNAYCSGSGGYLAQMSIDWGADWGPIENGLSGITLVSKIARSSSFAALYAATNLGFYKIYDIAATPPLTWSSRTYGIGTPNLGSVVADPANSAGLLVSSAPGVIPPHIWASGDSGRSWIELPLNDIPNDASINGLYASQDIYSNNGFIAATSKGMFQIQGIFKSGSNPSDETWGPGVVIVNGDYTIGHGGSVTILSPCTIYFTYNFDLMHSGTDSNKPEIFLQNSAGQHITKLQAIGSPTQRIVFTSSRPTNKVAGDWFGITAMYQSAVILHNCDIEYATKGVFEQHSGLPMSTLDVQNCTFSNILTAGIDLEKSTEQSSQFLISNSTFTNCGQYGIMVRTDDHTLNQMSSVSILNNEIVNCGYGVWYSGSTDIAGSKDVGISNNIIRRTAALTGSYGIYISPLNYTVLPAR